MVPITRGSWGGADEGRVFSNHRRYSFTELTNPDFELIARGNHIPYRCVESHADLDDAIAEMKECHTAFLLEVRVEREENVFPMVPAGMPVNDIRLE